MEDLGKNILKDVINNIIEKVENIDPKNIISAKYDGNLNKHTIRYVDKDKMVYTITVETQGLKNLNNITNKKLSVNDRHAKVIELIDAGLSQTDISKQLGVSQKTISNDVKFLNKMKEAEKAFNPKE